MLFTSRSTIAKCNELFDCRREAAASDEQQLRTPEDGRIAQLTTETLVTRINSLLYIEENLPAMEKIVQDRSACILYPLSSLHACHCQGMSHCMACEGMSHAWHARLECLMGQHVYQSSDVAARPPLATPCII